MDQLGVIENCIDQFVLAKIAWSSWELVTENCMDQLRVSENCMDLLRVIFA
jgi:hypothetical protein